MTKNETAFPGSTPLIIHALHSEVCYVILLLKIGGKRDWL